MKEVQENQEKEKMMKLIYEVQDHFINDSKDSKLMVKLHTDYENEATKQEILKAARREFSLRKVSEEQMELYIHMFEEYMWRYYVIEPLINDDNITDINLYNEEHVTVLTGDNKRYVTDVKFHDRNDYLRFIRVTALKNEVNLSHINAQQVFVDATSNEKYKMRIDISTELINCSGSPYMHIRKNPKQKYQTEDLVHMGTMSEAEMDYIIQRFNEGTGMLIVGEGNSGKSTLLNALLDKADHNKKILVTQESDGELFTDPNKDGHPDILFQHLIQNRGEGGVNYLLGDLIEKGLVSDFNMFIIGEVKDNLSASKLLNASFTGAQAVTTLHGPDEFAGIEKMADYVCQGTGYRYAEALKLLRTFETIVFMKKRKLAGIAEIKGWDYKNERLLIEPADIMKGNLSDFLLTVEGWR